MSTCWRVLFVLLHNAAHMGLAQLGTEQSKLDYHLPPRQIQNRFADAHHTLVRAFEKVRWGEHGTEGRAQPCESLVLRC